MTAVLFCSLSLAAYLIGSISFAYLAGRTKGLDLRQHGSGNLGANNAGRVLGRHWFFIVFACDLVKGLAAVLAARFLPQHLGWEGAPVLAQALALAVAAGVILGHAFPCYHAFRGGKAVATSLGVLIALLPLVAAIGLGVWVLAWLAIARLARCPRSDAVGPASVLAALAVPAAQVLTGRDALGADGWPLTGFTALVAALVLILHRGNIAQAWKRLHSGGHA